MNEIELARFHDLRRRDLAGDAFTADESRELIKYVALLENEERVALQAAHDERESQIATLDEQVVRMRSLIARREALAEYLRRIAQEVDAEREAIEVAFRQLIVTAEPSSKNLAGVSP